MKKKNIQISSPCIGTEEHAALRAPLDSGWLTQGPKVAEFEKAFAKMHGVEFALATTSCTTALHLILATMDIGPGDEVIVPSFTWIATANVVVYCGATPVFVDVQSDTFNIDPEDVARKLSSRTRAVIAVHLFGLCVDVAALRKALPSDVSIIEDAACAAGAVSDGVFAGSLGEIAAFSFHPRKTITTGEGGMITTNNSMLAEKANILRNHGASISEEQRHKGNQPYLLPEFNLPGFNYRMTDLQGALGLIQLGKLEKFITERAQWAAWYFEQLQDIDWLHLPKEPDQGRHAWQAFVTNVDPRLAPMSRNDIMDKLQQAGISTRPGTHAVHMLGYYKNKFGLQSGDHPVTYDCDRNTMAIPLHNKMDLEDYEYVVSGLKNL